jgi:hypothetical protein
MSPIATRALSVAVFLAVLGACLALKFIEDDFLQGRRLDPATDGRPESRPRVGEDMSILGDLRNDFDFNQSPRQPLILNSRPKTDDN